MDILDPTNFPAGASVEDVAGALGVTIGTITIECTGLDCSVIPDIKGYIAVDSAAMAGPDLAVVHVTVARFIRDGPGGSYSQADAYTLQHIGSGVWRIVTLERLAES